jgi:hypothetical protein
LVAAEQEAVKKVPQEEPVQEVQAEEDVVDELRSVQTTVRVRSSEANPGAF